MKSSILISLACFVFFCSCSKDSELNSEAEIIKMNFAFGEVYINNEKGTANAPDNTNLKQLIPNIEVSKGATVYPPSGTMLDFSETVDFTVTSEDKKVQNYFSISINLPIAEFKVYDCTACTNANPSPTIVAGAKIEIFKEENQENVKILELFTDNNGEITFYGDRTKLYYAIVSKGNAQCTKDGYLIRGVAQTQEDIYNCSYYMNDVEIGDLIYWDLNGDGRLDNQDHSDYLHISYDEYYGLDNNVYITE
ncbi:hypothetical protein E9993_16590 [Labilibacter sediminis]|nr:hypothetical protein E9993_16590 [Labilibacter sediminis]